MHTPCKALITFFCISLSFIQVSAQNKKNSDYIVGRNNDTIYGRFKHFAIPIAVTKKKLVTPDNVVYTFDNNSFTSYFDSRKNDLRRMVVVEDKSEAYFMQCLSDGRIKLYADHTYSGNVSNTTYYVQKDSAKAFFLRTNALGGPSRKERKERFAALLNDNPDILAKYNNLNSFSFTTIHDIVVEYNNYMSQKL